MVKLPLRHGLALLVLHSTLQLQHHMHRHRPSRALDGAMNLDGLESAESGEVEEGRRTTPLEKDKARREAYKLHPLNAPKSLHPVRQPPAPPLPPAVHNLVGRADRSAPNLAPRLSPQTVSQSHTDAVEHSAGAMLGGHLGQVGRSHRADKVDGVEALGAIPGDAPQFGILEGGAYNCTHSLLICVTRC